MLPLPGSQPEPPAPDSARCPDLVLHAPASCERGGCPGPRRPPRPPCPGCQGTQPLGRKDEGWPHQRGGKGRGGRVRRWAPGSPARPASPSASSSSRVRLGLGSSSGSISTPRLGGRRTCLVLAADAGRFEPNHLPQAPRWAGGEVSTVALRQGHGGCGLVCGRWGSGLP